MIPPALGPLMGICVQTPKDALFGFYALHSILLCNKQLMRKHSRKEVAKCYEEPLLQRNYLFFFEFFLYARSFLGA